MPQPSIFVSHTREQSAAVRRLTSELIARGFTIAVNRYTVPPGKRIQPAVEEAMAAAARCLVCFSAKEGGQVEYDADDVRLVNARMQQQPTNAAWLIPVKLTDCDLPVTELGGIPANELSAVAFHSEWAVAFDQLLVALPPPPARDDASKMTEPLTSLRRAAISEEIGIVTGKHVVVTGLEGTTGADVSLAQKIDKIVSDGSVAITGVKR